MKKPYPRGKDRESTPLGPPAFLTNVLNYMTLDNITLQPKKGKKEKYVAGAMETGIKDPSFHALSYWAIKKW